METKRRAIIIVLFILALFLGAVIFAQQWRGRPEAGEPTGVSPGDVPWSQGSLSDAEAVLIFPGQGASREEFDAHQALVNKLAEKATHLDITKCTPAPLVLAHVRGENLTVKNQDVGVGYVLRLGTNDIIIPAGKSVVVEAHMIGLGYTGYGCHVADIPNPATGTVGVIRSTEQ